MKCRTSGRKTARYIVRIRNGRGKFDRRDFISFAGYYMSTPQVPGDDIVAISVLDQKRRGRIQTISASCGLSRSPHCLLVGRRIVGKGCKMELQWSAFSALFGLCMENGAGYWDFSDPDPKTYASPLSAWQGLIAIRTLPR
jgi:hypothetical protein